MGGGWPRVGLMLRKAVEGSGSTLALLGLVMSAVHRGLASPCRASMRAHLRICTCMHVRVRVVSTPKQRISKFGFPKHPDGGRSRSRHRRRRRAASQARGCGGTVAGGTCPCGTCPLAPGPPPAGAGPPQKNAVPACGIPSQGGGHSAVENATPPPLLKTQQCSMNVTLTQRVCTPTHPGFVSLASLRSPI